MKFKEQIENYFEMEWGRKLLSSEEGFIFYEIRENELFVTDFYISEEYQGKGKGLDLAKQVEEIAVKNKCDFLTCLLSCGKSRAHSSTELMRKYINFGFKIFKADGDIIRMIKFIEERENND